MTRSELPCQPPVIISPKSDFRRVPKTIELRGFNHALYGINRFLANWIFNVLGLVAEGLASRKRKEYDIPLSESVSTPYERKTWKLLRPKLVTLSITYILAVRNLSI